MDDNARAQAGPMETSCRYGGSRLRFRGPERALDGRHIAFVGGSETCGRALEAPFPARVEAGLGVPCVNFGQVNASAEAFLHDPVVGPACQSARVTVLEAMGAANLSNRFYSVHPRRNDRFLRAAPALRAVFPKVDFAEVCFTRHLLTRLWEEDAERFEVVREELRIAWAARMRNLIGRAGPRVLLLRFVPEGEGGGPLGRDPLFVTGAMVEGLRPSVLDVVEVAAPAPGKADARLAAHRAAAEALVGPLRAALGASSLRASA